MSGAFSLLFHWRSDGLVDYGSCPIFRVNALPQFNVSTRAIAQFNVSTRAIAQVEIGVNALPQIEVRTSPACCKR